MYRSSGKLGAFLESAACDGSYSASVGREIDYLRSNRVSLVLRRFAVVPVSTNVQPRMMQEMLCSLIITEALVKNSAKPTGLISAAEEPSSDDGAGEGDDDGGDDDEMFCVRPNGDGIQGWDMANGKSPVRRGRGETKVRAE